MAGGGGGGSSVMRLVSVGEDEREGCWEVSEVG